MKYSNTKNGSNKYLDMRSTTWLAVLTCCSGLWMLIALVVSLY